MGTAGEGAGTGEASGNEAELVEPRGGFLGPSARPQVFPWITSDWRPLGLLLDRGRTLESVRICISVKGAQPSPEL